MRIYQDAQAVLVNAFTIAARMKKEHRLVAGASLCDRSLTMAEAVAVAYMEKSPRLKAVRIRGIVRACVAVLALHRMAGCVNICSRDLYAEQVARTVSVMQQAQAWLASCQGNEQADGEQF